MFLYIQEKMFLNMSNNHIRIKRSKVTWERTDRQDQGWAYRGTSLIRNRHPLRPHSRTVPGAQGGVAGSYARGTPVLRTRDPKPRPETPTPNPRRRWRRVGGPRQVGEGFLPRPDPGLGPTEGPMWGHPMPVLGALSPFLEPFCGHLSPKLDKVS